MKYRTGAFMISAVMVLAGCLTADVREEKQKDVVRSEDSRTRAMLETVKNINDNAPVTISASLTVDGTMKTKKFKAQGTARYDRKENKMSLAFIDYIFKSPITHIFQDNAELVFYFPVDKKIFQDNINTINLLNYNSIDIDFRTIKALATGQIPVIEDYRVKDSLASSADNKSYLILENNLWFETISFSAGQPDRIKLVNKKSREEIEIYLKKMIRSERGIFFQQISIVVKNLDTRLEIQFSNIKLNKPVVVQSINDLKIPRDVQTIKM